MADLCGYNSDIEQHCSKVRIVRHKRRAAICIKDESSNSIMTSICFGKTAARHQLGHEFLQLESGG